MSIDRRARWALLLIGIAVMAGTGCFEDPDDDDPGLGTITVDPSPDIAMAPWELAVPNGYTAYGAGDSIVENMPEGKYLLTWRDKPGWVTPTPSVDSLMLPRGGNGRFTGRYRGFGTVVIDASPDAIRASWTLTTPDREIIQGEGDARLTILPEGEYAIAWTDVEDYVTPSPNPAAGILSPQDSLTFHGDYAPRYHQMTHPDSVAANFVLAWISQDIDEYRDRILYDGVELASDGSAYPPFTFYFSPDPDHPGLPVLYSCEQEVQAVTNMFSGEPGNSGTPGIKSIELALYPFGADWENPLNPTDVEGDSYPEGTRQRYYSTDLLIRLKFEIPGTGITGFVVTDRLWFHVIPVQVGDQVEYRLWKWRDILDDLRVEFTTWGLVKTMYY